MVGGQRGWAERVERKKARNSNLLRVAWQILSADVFTEKQAGGILATFFAAFTSVL